MNKSHRLIKETNKIQNETISSSDCQKFSTQCGPTDNKSTRMTNFQLVLDIRLLNRCSQPSLCQRQLPTDETEEIFEPLIGHLLVDSKRPN